MFDVLQGLPSGVIASSAGEGGRIVLGWALLFLIIALIAATFGFTGIAASAAGIARILFCVFLLLFVVTSGSGLIRRPIP
jgi:uncharacterized membrane protein YtjA (UPF0391 family)